LTLWLALAALALLLNRYGWSGLGAPGSILAVKGLLAGLCSFLLLSLFHQLKSPLLLPPELALYALPWIALTSAHREGQLDRPFNLVEPAWAAGFDPLRLFASIGVSLGMMLVLLAACRRSRQTGGISWPGLLLPMLAGMACLALLPVEKLNRISTERKARESLSSGALAGPETPVAVVVLYQDGNPETGLYHFGTSSPQALPAKERGQVAPLHYRVAELARLPEPLVMGQNAEILPVNPAAGQTFARVYDVKSSLPSQSLAELLDLPAQAPLRPGGKFASLTEAIVPVQDRGTPLRAALRIKLWMEQNRAQISEPGASSPGVAACLNDNRAVDQRTYTMAAQELMDSLGLTTWLVHGYAVRADQRGEGSYLLVNESDRRYWLLLWLEQSGPVVLDLYPLQGPADSAGPRNQELQRQLGELARARGAASQPLPGFSSWAIGFILFLAIVGAGGQGIKVYRRLRILWCAPSKLPTWGYLVVLDRLAEVGELRLTGETRLEFAHRLRDRVPSLEPLTHLHQKAQLGHPGNVAHDNARPLIDASLQECARSYGLGLRVLGRLHPFAWMKVL
jgi:hypothetical protein